jgi:Cof subfamily protein (haloacid dehalogenase superfamily)
MGVQMQKTLYISDLDGTLLDKNGTLSEYAGKILSELTHKGCFFSIATARSSSTAFRIVTGLQWNVPTILMNGTIIFDPNEQRYVRILSIPVDTIYKIISVLKQLSITGLIYRLTDGELITYYENLDDQPIRDFVEERKLRFKKRFIPVTSFDEIMVNDVIYFTLINYEQPLKQVAQALAGLTGINVTMYKDNYSDELWYLEIHSNLASKQSGVDFLRKEYGFDRVICFGDNLNDLPMFSASDVSVAVSNAKAEVKTAADHICGSNEENGVVKWLLDHLKDEQ